MVPFAWWKLSLKKAVMGSEFKHLELRVKYILIFIVSVIDNITLFSASYMAHKQRIHVRIE